MNTRITHLTARTIVLIFSAIQYHASELDSLQGKWVATKTNQENQVYSQVIEIEKAQLTFQIVGPDSKPRLVSRGTIKAAKMPPFDLLTMTDIRAGPSEQEMQPVDDTRTAIYAVRDGNLFLASNFDRVRENEKPHVEMYARKEAGTKHPDAAGPETKLLGNWKMDLTMGDNTYDYELRIANPGDRLEAVLISPRSGEHRCKTARFENGAVLLEVDREIQGNAVTFVYEGKLTADSLSGKAHVKGQEDQLSGTWKASKK